MSSSTSSSSYREKLRSLLEKMRVKETAPISFPSSIESAPQTQLSLHSTPSAVPANAAATQVSMPLSGPSRFPLMSLVECPDDRNKYLSTRRVFISLSSDLRLLHFNSRSSPPTSLLDFRRPDHRLSLERMPDISSTATASTNSLETLVAPRVEPVVHPSGFAVRITEKKQTILLIASSMDERDFFLSALCFRVAPWAALRLRIELEMRGSHALSASAMFSAAVRGFVVEGSAEKSAEAVNGSSKQKTEVEGVAGMAKCVWEKAGFVAEISIWAATIGPGVAGVARTAEQVESLAKPFGGLTIFGCAFSLVALSARAVGLFLVERKGRTELAGAREELREGSVSMMGWLFSILGSGYEDEDGLVGRVFDALKECWISASDLEQYLLRSRFGRVWHADVTREIICKVEAVKEKLFDVCLLKEIAGLGDRLGDHEGRIGKLEVHLPVEDQFRSNLIAQSNLGFGLLPSASIILSRLKAAVLAPRTGSATDSEGGMGAGVPEPMLCHVALTSVNGEGGVGKTSSCKVLCADAEVRNHFSGGAIVWINVGRGATDGKIRNELQKAVSSCGGKRSADEVRSSCDIFEAINIATAFFVGYRILVIIDNVWEAGAECNVCNWAVELSKIASSPGSAVIMTTRFASLSSSPGFTRVPLGRFNLEMGSSDWAFAESLYDALLKPSAEDRASSDYRQNRSKALQLSCGLLLGISTFAGLVRNRLSMHESIGSVFAKLEQNILSMSGASVGSELKSSVGHGGLFVVMEECLLHLDTHEALGSAASYPPAPLGRVEGEHCRTFTANYDAFAGKLFSARYAALELMSAASRRLSLSILSHLWHVESSHMAEEVARHFVNIGLGEIEITESSGGAEKFFVLHDLQHEYCARVRQSLNEFILNTANLATHIMNGHSLILSAYESLLDCSCREDGKRASWAELCFNESLRVESVDSMEWKVSRRYIAQNLFRHLCAAAPVTGSVVVRQLVLDMLTDFRWLRGSIVDFGRASTLWVFLESLGCRSQSEFHVEELGMDDNQKQWVRELERSLILAGGSLSVQSDGALATSIFWSLIKTTGNGLGGNLSRKLCDSVESEVKGQWLRPVSGWYPVHETGVLVRKRVGARVGSLASLGDGQHFLSAGRDGLLRVHDSFYLATTLTLHADFDGLSTEPLVGAKISESMFLVFAGTSDGTLRVWVLSKSARGVLSESFSSVVAKFGSGVTALSVSIDGSVVAAGCDNFTAIWKCALSDKPEEPLALELLTKSSKKFRVLEPGSAIDFSRGVEVSRSGKVVVGWCLDGSVVLWGAPETSAVRKLQIFLLPGDRRVIRAMISADESSLILLLSSPKRSVGCSEVSCEENSHENRIYSFEVWDVATVSKRFDPVVLLQCFRISCATLLSEEDDRGILQDKLLICGADMMSDHFLAQYSIAGSRSCTESFRRFVDFSPRSMCIPSGVGGSRLIFGCYDGCIRLFRTDLFAGGDDTDQSGNFTRQRYLSGPPVEELMPVTAVSVLPCAGYVVTGHRNGMFSFWDVRTGNFVRLCEGCVFLKQKERVNCIEVSADETLSLSGHDRGVVIVWETSKWRACHELNGHSDRVVCVVLSRDATRAVTVDLVGEVRIWATGKSGPALCAVETGQMFSFYGSRGAISRTESTFVWSGSAGIWTSKINLVKGSVAVGRTEEKLSDMGLFLDALRERYSLGKNEPSLFFGAVEGIRMIDLPSNEFGKPADIWRISASSTGQGILSRIDFALLPEDGDRSRNVSLEVDAVITSIAVKWMHMDDSRCAIVACTVSEKSEPAILHFFLPRNDNLSSYN